MTAEIATSLNRLAGTTGLEATAAANVWAGKTRPYLELLGALNLRNGTTGLGLNAVCNQLAGTTNLEAQAALDNAAFGPVDLGNTWASIDGTWAQQLETWSNA